MAPLSISLPAGAQQTEVGRLTNCDEMNRMVSAMLANRGGQLDLWSCTTICFCKIDDKWMVTQDHNSIPFDVESGKASLDFKP